MAALGSELFFPVCLAQGGQNMARWPDLAPELIGSGPWVGACLSFSKTGWACGRGS